VSLADFRLTIRRCYDIVLSDMRLHACFALLFAVLLALGQADCAHQGEPLQRRASASIELRLKASADAAFPLFGPVRESEWASDWSPVWIYPANPLQSADGAVFTTSGHAGVSTWVMTIYDMAGRTVEYVNFIPGQRVTQVSITVRPDTAATSIARVSYRVTALSEEGSAFVAHFAKEFSGEGPHWEKAINDGISKNKHDIGNGVGSGKPK
jgi:hypothetical protein